MIGDHRARCVQVFALVASILISIISTPAAADDTDASCLATPGWTRLSFPESTPAGPNPSYREGALSIAQSWKAPSRWYGGGVDGLYLTDDCGRSWTRLPHLGTIVLPDQSFHYSIVAVTPSGRLFADRADWRLSWTDDDGQTWNSLGGMGIHPYPLYFLRSGVGWGVFYQPTRGGGGAQTLAFSTDDGVTWQHGVRGGMPRVLGVDTRDENALVSVRRDGEIVRSTDLYATATTWATFSSRVHAVIANDDGTRFWVATAEGVLYRSRDGGQSWEDAGQTPGAIRENGLSVSHHDPNAFFAINELGELWYFRDVVVATPTQLP